MKKIFAFFFFFPLIVSIFLPLVAQAEGEGGEIINLEFPKCNPDIGECPTIDDETTDITLYIVRLYQFAVGAAGIVAVGMIVAGAIYISVSGSIDKKGEGKDMITSALWGLALLFGSYLILNSINPQLVSLKNPGADERALQGECLEYEEEIPESQITHPIDPNIRVVKNGDTTKYCGPKAPPNNDCGSFDAITVWSGSAEVSLDNSGALSTCKTRRVKIQKAGETIDDDLYYDDGENFPALSTVWLYPYFPPDDNGNIQEGDPPRCLIYAVERPDDNEVEMIDLDSDLRICAPKKQNAITDIANTTPCTSCVNLTGIPIKSSNACSASTCKVNDALFQKLNALKTSLANVGESWQVTEAWPPTVEHESQCHKDGTCVDIALLDNLSCDRIQKFIDAVKVVGFNVVNEYSNLTSCTFNPPAQQFDTTTGGHLHVSI